MSDSRRRILVIFGSYSAMENHMDALQLAEGDALSFSSHRLTTKDGRVTFFRALVKNADIESLKGMRFDVVTEHASFRRLVGWPACKAALLRPDE